MYNNSVIKIQYNEHICIIVPNNKLPTTMGLLPNLSLVSESHCSVAARFLFFLLILEAVTE